MKCAWQQLLGILPRWLAEDVDRLGKENLQELRLRLDREPELNFGRTSQWLTGKVTREDLAFVVNTASRYSPWAAKTVKYGYLTAPGGHRIGICGESVIREGRLDGIRQLTSLNLRVARDFPGIGKEAAKLSGSVLVLGPPGCGKTTLLRDMIRHISTRETVGVVDERQELFPDGLQQGLKTDIIFGCTKAEGIETLLRTMGPSCIAVDEITSEADCRALISAGWCGVRLVATAHAGSLNDLRCRPVYRQLYGCGLFDHVLVLDRSKNWREERMVG